MEWFNELNEFWRNSAWKLFYGKIALNLLGIGLAVSILTVVKWSAFKKQSKLEGDYKYSEDRVVVDNKLVTSRGPGTCFEFAFKLAELLVDKDMSDQLKSQTLALTAWNYGLWNHRNLNVIFYKKKIDERKSKVFLIPLLAKRSYLSSGKHFTLMIIR